MIVTVTARDGSTFQINMNEISSSSRVDSSFGEYTRILMKNGNVYYIREKLSDLIPPPRYVEKG